MEGGRVGSGVGGGGVGVGGGGVGVGVGVKVRVGVGVGVSQYPVVKIGITGLPLVTSTQSVRGAVKAGVLYLAYRVVPADR